MAERFRQVAGWQPGAVLGAVNTLVPRGRTGMLCSRANLFRVWMGQLTWAAMLPRDRCQVRYSSRSQAGSR